MMNYYPSFAFLRTAIVTSLCFVVTAVGAFGLCPNNAYAWPSAMNSSQAATSYDLTTLRSWASTVANGDVNRDGIDDILIIATPHFKEMLTLNELGDTIDANKHVLAIFFGNGNGGYTCKFQSEDVLPVSENTYHILDFTLDVNAKGVFSIRISHFSSVGGWGNTNESYVFRYQNNDFFLIGEDEDYYMRNTGEATKTSINYLTHRKQVIDYNVFDDTVKPKEKWSRIPSQPLRRLGSWTLGD